MVAAELKISDRLVGTWLSRMIKGLAPDYPIEKLAANDENFALILRIGALACRNAEDQAVLARALAEDRKQTRAFVARDEYWGEKAKKGTEVLRGWLMCDLPKRVAIKLMQEELLAIPGAH